MFSPHKISAWKKLVAHISVFLGTFVIISVLTHIIFGTLAAGFVIGMNVVFFERQRQLRSKTRRERNREITSASVDFDPQD